MDWSKPLYQKALQDGSLVEVWPMLNGKFKVIHTDGVFLVFNGW